MFYSEDFQKKYLLNMLLDMLIEKLAEIYCISWYVHSKALAVVTLQTFYLGKHDLLTVYLGKLDFLSVTDFSLANLPRGNFIVWVLDMSRKQ